MSSSSGCHVARRQPVRSSCGGLFPHTPRTQTIRRATIRLICLENPFQLYIISKFFIMQLNKRERKKKGCFHNYQVVIEALVWMGDLSCWTSADSRRLNFWRSSYDLTDHLPAVCSSHCLSC